MTVGRIRGALLKDGRQNRTATGGSGRRTLHLTGGATHTIPTSGGTASPGQQTAGTGGTVRTAGSEGQRHGGVSGMTIGGGDQTGRRGGTWTTRTREKLRRTARQCRLRSTSKLGRVTLGELWTTPTSYPPTT